MATAVQPDHLTSTIRSKLASVALPEGVTLHSVEFQNNSWGEPSIFVNYAVSSRDPSVDRQDGLLLSVLDATLVSVENLNLPFFVYVDFLTA